MSRDKQEDVKKKETVKIESPQMVPAGMLEAFEHAATLSFEVKSGDGKGEPALKEWDVLFNRVESYKGDLPLSFKGEVRMRRAWALMDLDRYEEAEELLADDSMGPYLDSFSEEVLYEYFFSFANVLGALGKKALMDEAMRKSLFIATEKLGDLEKCVRSWMNLMLFAEHNEWWPYLENVSSAAQKFCEEQGDSLDLLWVLSGVHKVGALKGQGRMEDAKKVGAKLLKKAQALNDEGVTKRVTEVLESIG
ncbi:MAG: hypothetical protein GXP49_15905 [Deltaproteobacteria bacterium]|nr:hypothetical protein [Deltaproteobacteria bacterium]